jgi:hypothetical protein
VESGRRSPVIVNGMTKGFLPSEVTRTFRTQEPALTLLSVSSKFTEAKLAEKEALQRLSEASVFEWPKAFAAGREANAATIAALAELQARISVEVEKT